MHMPTTDAVCLEGTHAYSNLLCMEQQQEKYAGVTIWRNTPGARSFAADWQRYMSNNELHQSGLDDQFSFNQLAVADLAEDGTIVRKFKPMLRSDTDPRVLLAGPNDATRLMVLPSAIFAGAILLWHCWAA